MHRKPTIAMGDPAGIGPELIVGVLDDDSISERCRSRLAAAIPPHPRSRRRPLPAGYGLRPLPAGLPARLSASALDRQLREPS